MIKNSILKIADDNLVEKLLFGNFKFSLDLEINSHIVKALVNESFFWAKESFSTIGLLLWIFVIYIYLFKTTKR